MLSHSGFTAQVAVLNQYFDLSQRRVALLPPLSHALERAWTYVVLANGSLNTYARPAVHRRDVGQGRSRACS